MYGLFLQDMLHKNSQAKTILNRADDIDKSKDKSKYTIKDYEIEYDGAFFEITISKM